MPVLCCTWVVYHLRIGTPRATAYTGYNCTTWLLVFGNIWICLVFYVNFLPIDNDPNVQNGFKEYRSDINGFIIICDRFF